MENTKLKKRKVELSNKIIPYFMGLSDDLMFFIAINNLFFTIVKGLTAAQITFLTTITGLAYIMIQVPALKIIQKIGNVKSIRIGTIMLLCSSLLITFGSNYTMIAIGYVLYQPAFIFKRMDHVVLKNNLSYLKKDNDYIKIANQAKIVYSIITMVIALIAGGIFAVNHYMPMYLCIGICIINILLSFCIFDSREENQNTNQDSPKVKIKFSQIVGMIFTSFALLYTTISLGQNNGKLFIQYNLQEHFEAGLTATFFSFIIVSSRIARIIGNIIFKKIYDKLKDKVNLILSVLTIIAFACVWIGSCLNSILVIKFIVMTIGFDLILAIRDPFDTYMTDLLLKHTTAKEQQKAISYLQLARRITETSISLIFSILLIKIDLFYIIICLMILAILALGINIKLEKMIKEK
ncbi:MAG: MFS transporter [Clostridia bacterium]|nr:MFS transporter [Clostridia bacterium]